MHHDVEELHDVRLQCGRRDALAADPLRVHHPGRACPQQLWLRLLGAGPRDDDEVGAERAGGQRDVDVFRVGVDGSHQSAGLHDARLAQHVVVGDVSGEGGVRCCRHPVGVVVHHNDLRTLARQVAADRTADPAPSADDGVPGHPGDLAFHPTPPEMLAQMPLHQRFKDHAKGVERGADPGQNQHDGENLARRFSGWSSRNPTVVIVVTVWYTASSRLNPSSR